PSRGNSERMKSCRDFSSSTNKTRKLLCDGVLKRSLLPICTTEAQGNLRSRGLSRLQPFLFGLLFFSMPVYVFGERFLQWQPDRESAPFTGTGADSLNFAAVLVD